MIPSEGGATAAPQLGRVAITGAAGLVGQNVILRLKRRGHSDLVAIDKHPRNTKVLSELNPDIEIVEADLNGEGWEQALSGADSLVVAHAQIGGIEPKTYNDNNVIATERVFAAAKAAKVKYAVQLSSSVVHSAVVDFYTESKKTQERVALESGLPVVVLRPTLMFGWFDRKHLGWLARFIQTSPVFPIPGDGRYLRQPLYVGDFCDIVIACLESRREGVFDITGLEQIDFIDLMRLVRHTLGCKTPIVKLPYGVFWAMLRAYALIDSDPPFTTMQLKALVTPDIFEVIDWPRIFGVSATPLEEALRETFLDPRYSKIRLGF